VKRFVWLVKAAGMTVTADSFARFSGDTMGPNEEHYCSNIRTEKHHFRVVEKKNSK
jgi:hypothetical protein